MGQTIVKCCVELLQRDDVGLPATVALGDAIAADAKFNLWFLQLKESESEADERLLSALDLVEDLTLLCQEAIRKFKESSDNKDWKMVDIRNQDLEKVLTEITVKLTEAMLVR
jgi:hypothetical protein